MNDAPRIYNLFPLLVGHVARWETHLARIAAMGFNWVFVNPFHCPGFSGSLYAVKDYYSLHPIFRGDSDKSDDEILRHFVTSADKHGLRVMMDLVINHTAKDSVLAQAHPEWFAHEEDGSIRSPFAADPDEPDNVAKRTVWGDLGEIDFEHSPDRQGLVRFWQDLVRHYARIGFAGFRGDAAYKVPGEVWGEVIGAAREAAPGTCFFAESLGCQPKEVVQLNAAGFDYLFNSSKWWDFRADWLLEQYETFRHIAPSIAFPESHDTERVAEDSGGDIRVSRMHYLFAAAYSSGLMMPIGYEYGFRRKPHVVESRPQDWEPVHFDLTDFISRVNRMKASTPVLNEEGPQRRITPAGDPVVALLREGETVPGRVLTLINPDPRTRHRFSAAETASMLACEPEAMRELTPEAASGEWIDLPPLSIRLFTPTDA
jgi:starch synthase (maltosyl-transferring)